MIALYALLLKFHHDSPVSSFRTGMGGGSPVQGVWSLHKRIVVGEVKSLKRELVCMLTQSPQWWIQGGVFSCACAQ